MTASAPAKAPTADGVSETDGPFAFTDVNGRRWVVEVTTTAVLRVRSLCDVDIMEAIEGTLIPKLVNDPMLMVNVLYGVCKPQCEAAGVSDMEFGESLGGGVIWQARECLKKAIVFFSPPEKRMVVKTMWERAEGLTEKAAEAAVVRMGDPSLDREIVRIVMAGHLPGTTPGDSSGSVPESSASTPAR